MKLYAGWYISQTNITVCLAEKRRKKLTVVSTANKTIDAASDDALSSAICELMKSLQEKTAKVYHSITFPLDEVYSDVLALPERGRYDSEKMLRHEVQTLVAKSTNMLFFTTRKYDISSENAYAVFGIPRKLFYSICNELNQDPDLVSISIAEDAMLRAFNFCRNTAVDSIVKQTDKVITCVCRKGDCLAHTLTMPVRDINDRKSAFDRLLSVFPKHYDECFSHVVLDSDKDMKQYYTQQLIINKEVADVQDNDSFNREELFAYGAILQTVQGKEYVSLIKKQLKNGSANKLFISMCIILGSLVVFFGAELLRYIQMNTQKKEMRELVKSEFYRILDKNTPFIDPIAQIKRQQAAHNEKSEYTDRQIAYAPELIISIDQTLADIPEIVPDSMSLTGNQVVIQGTSPDFDMLHKWKDKILLFPNVAAVDVENAVRNQSTGAVSFNVKITLLRKK